MSEDDEERKFVVGASNLDKPFLRNGDVIGLVLPPDGYICNSCGSLGFGDPRPVDLMSAPEGTCLTCGHISSMRTERTASGRTQHDSPDVHLEEGQSRVSARWEDRDFRAERVMAERLRPDLRPATAEEYRRWLAGYVDNGNKPTRAYDYPMAQDLAWYVAPRPVAVPPLHGASAVHLIVPGGVEIAILPGHSHNMFFYMDGYRHYRQLVTIVPTYTDTVVM